MGYLFGQNCGFRFMDDLAARLQSLLRRYAAECGQGNCGWSWRQFHNDLRTLIAECGPQAVDAALDQIPDEPGPPISLH
jgi:hypothetical protein